MIPHLVLAARPGFSISATEEFTWPCIVPLRLVGVNACINRVALLYFLAAIVVGVLFVLAFRRPRLVPTGLQNVMEAFVGFIRDQIALEVIGPRGLPWVPFLATMFAYLFVSNVFEIIPVLQFPPTGRMAVPAFLAIVVWFLFVGVGVREQGFFRYFFGIAFPPGVPKVIYVILTPVEIFSTLLVRPFTLAVRLLANMIAGHLMLAIFFLGTAYLLVEPKTIPFAAGSLLMGILIDGLELVIDILQAYIFTILTAVYIAGALSPEH